MLKIKLAAQRSLSPQEEQALALVDLKVGEDLLFSLNLDEDKTYLCSESKKLQFKPWWIDLLQPRMLIRLKQCGRKNEAVARAVIASDETDPLIFDATAGLGRDALIIQSSGARVWMFERNPIIYLLLYDALLRAQKSPEKTVLKYGLPRLMPIGTLLEHAHSLPVPSAIYYDPMFPARTKSALVKKDMQLFHFIAGTDSDTETYLKSLCTLGSRRVVLKRPQYAEEITPELKPHFSIDGKTCRYDCYMPHLKQSGTE